MDLEEIKKRLADAANQRKQAEQMFHQLTGVIQTLQLQANMLSAKEPGDTKVPPEELELKE